LLAFDGGRKNFESLRRLLATTPWQTWRNNDTNQNAGRSDVQRCTKESAAGGSIDEFALGWHMGCLHLG
jgi:hypothetical protein